MLAERLQKQWRENVRFRPIHSSMSLEREGLVLGSGTVLAPAESDSFGRHRLRLDGAEARLLTLLSIAYGRPISPSVLDHIRRGARQWNLGEECRAALHLAFARLPKFANPREAAQRLFLADGLISSGIPLRDVLDIFEINQATPVGFRKDYDENQPRVPAGNGRESGRWTAGFAGFLASLPESELAPLASFAARFTGPAAMLGLLFIPNRALGRTVEGQIAGAPDLHYAWDEDETLLRIMQGRGRIVLEARLGADGIFHDDRQRVVGRALDDQLILDTAALRAELPKGETEDEEPKLCPVPGRDKAGRTSARGEKDRDYEDYVKRLINPDNPTPRGFGVQLPNPQKGGMPVFYDDCQRRTGLLIEAKGTGYAEPLARQSDFMRNIFTAQWLDQARRQVAASGGRPIEWHFAERGAADYARKLFADNKDLAQINVVYTPWSEDWNEQQ